MRDMTTVPSLPVCLAAIRVAANTKHAAPRWRRFLSVAALALASACGGGGNGGSLEPPVAAGTPPAYTLSIDPPALTVGQGREAWLSVTVTRDAGFDGAIEVTLNQPPAGVLADTLVLEAGIDSGPLPIRLAADLATGSVLTLDVKASSGELIRSATSTLTVSLPQPHAQAALAAALQAGSIDYGTSLLYRAYALFGDARLPDAYLGAGSVEEDNLLFEEIRLRLAEFPSERQAELRAFIVRPTDARSVWNGAPLASGREQPAQVREQRAALPPESCASLPDGAWVSKLSSKYSVRVWMQCGPAPITDAVVQRLIDATLAVLEKVYVPMTDMLGPPRSDLGEGGDGAIDFYIVHDSGSVRRSAKNFTPAGLGVTYSSVPFVGNRTSAFVLLPRSTLLLPNAHTTIIHEFFHVLQNAHNAFLYGPKGCVDDACKWHWFGEASAAWAGAYFDRTLWSVGRAAYVASYYRYAGIFQPSDAALNATDDGSKHDYSAFIWPYFVEQETKSTAFMTQIWNGLSGIDTFEAADDVINAAYPFALNFPRFAVRNLNHEFAPGGPLPKSERFVNLDPAQFKTADNKEPPYLPGDLVAESAYSQPLELANLSARYVRLTINGTNIRKVVLDTGGLAPGGSLVTQALILTTTGWVAKPVDLVNGKTVFCFDLGPSTESVRGSFEEIVLVLSNHALRKGERITGDLKAMPTATPCATVWEGTIESTRNVPLPGGTLEITSSAQMAFAFDKTNSDSVSQAFQVRAGNYTYRAYYDFSQRNPPCRTVQTAAGSMHAQGESVDLSDGSTAGVLATFVSSDGRPQYTNASVLTFTTLTEVSNCNGRNVDITTLLPMSTMALWVLEQQVYDIKENGTTMQDTRSISNGTATSKYTWLLTKKASGN